MNGTKWLTIAEASLLCSQMGLERTPKTIRGWARNEHVSARKKSTSNGEMWILEKASLEIKINTEIEYRDQMKTSKSGSDMSEPVQPRRNGSEQARTGAYLSETVLTGSESSNGYKEQAYGGANGGEPQRKILLDPSAKVEIKALEAKIMTLSIDVGWREEALKRLREDNEKGQETLHAQARYIGHLESDLMRLGGKPDQTFLSAPKPQEPAPKQSAVEPVVMDSQRPHPD